MSAIVTVFEENEKLLYEVEEGISVIEFLRNNDYKIDACCGGNGRCGKCVVKISGDISQINEEEKRLLSGKELFGFRLACKTNILGNCEINLELKNNDILTSFNGKLSVNTKKHGKGLAIDIGTTTIAAYGYDLETLQPIGVISRENPQRLYGSDVISRIDASANIEIRKKLENLIVSEINSIASELFKDVSEITSVVIAGNTTMLHILCGLNPEGLAKAPFVGESLFGTEYNGRQLGFNFSANVFLCPCVSAYVGGDITAGLIAANIDQDYETVLFLDLGTNGEIALKSGNEILCCSAAAGPVFEGAHIKYGVPGVEGAISNIFINNNKVEINTISSKTPIGICGSGIVDAVAELLNAKLIDETGFMDEEFILNDSPRITITPQDIREVQLAKSAIISGIIRLCIEADIMPSDISKVVLAGGMGSGISAKSAARIGLFDDSLENKCVVIGNAAGKGALEILCDDNARERVEQIPEICKYIELSGDKIFNELYIENMLFREG